MNFLIDRDCNIQINEQITAQLRYQILNGELKKDTKLPSVREMASALNINRHTISKSYKELEDEGLIVSKKSLGTFVSNQVNIPPRKDLTKFIEIINKSIDASNELGFTTKEFLEMTQSIYLNEKNNKKIKGLFVECNYPALKEFVKDTRKELEIEVDGCLLSEIENGDMGPNKIDEYDLIMTTVGHYPTLKRALKNKNNLYALNFGPYLNVLNEIKDLAPDSDIGIVCINETGAVGLKQILIDLGIVEGIILAESAIDLKKVEKMAEQVDLLVISKFALEENREFFTSLPNKQIIEYTNTLQQTSIMMLQEVISHIKENFD